MSLNSNGATIIENKTIPDIEVSAWPDSDLTQDKAIKKVLQLSNK
ncbi:hypothetical protein [Clostridium amazonitimonense]|nr:hypothetical protein [Clostridium amazonitimonense]